MSTRVALPGAGGTMGCRITDNLKDRHEYEAAFVEAGQEGIACLWCSRATNRPPAGRR